MRNIKANLFISVDGVVEAPEHWSGPYFSPRLGQTIGELMATAGTLLLGRVTYETFAAAFADDTSGRAYIDSCRGVGMTDRPKA